MTEISDVAANHSSVDTARRAALVTLRRFATDVMTAVTTSGGTINSDGTLTVTTTGGNSGAIILTGLRTTDDDLNAYTYQVVEVNTPAGYTQDGPKEISSGTATARATFQPSTRTASAVTITGAFSSCVSILWPRTSNLCELMP